MISIELDYICNEPSAQADACVIWLHGLGADGHDFADITPALQLPESHKIRFIFPHAPIRPVTLNANMEMPAWFDIFGLDLHAKVDKEGIEQAEKALHRLIDLQVQQSIPYHRIFLIGFSQGGALTLYTALRYPKRLAGVAGLSTFLPLQQELSEALAQQDKTLPIFLAHGVVDPIVPYWLGQQSSIELQKIGYDPAWHSYPIVHSVSQTECIDLGQWIKDILYK